MTLDRPMARVDEELRQLHLRMLADILDARHGADRAGLAHAYARLLSEMEQEARALRNSEIHRMAGAGAGPAEVGRTLGVTRGRGDQVIRSAAESKEQDEGRVAKLRRQVASWRRDL
jgi:hypothetical protein